MMRNAAPFFSMLYVHKLNKKDIDVRNLYLCYAPTTERRQTKKEDSKGDYTGTLTSNGIEEVYSLMNRIWDAAEYMMASRLRKIENGLS
ncbi:MAG TPA: hypothetical protein VE619_00925 [Nitrososphaeraceae archaeon]|nr:hypothetical protein [Nitrososphaeraceae archaeon]